MGCSMPPACRVWRIRESVPWQVSIVIDSTVTLSSHRGWAKLSHIPRLRTAQSAILQSRQSSLRLRLASTKRLPLTFHSPPQVMRRVHTALRHPRSTHPTQPHNPRQGLPALRTGHALSKQTTHATALLKYKGLPSKLWSAWTGWTWVARWCHLSMPQFASRLPV